MGYMTNKERQKLLDFFHGGRRKRKRYENKIRKSKDTYNALAIKTCDNRRER
jgi:hypothetical protein